MVHRSLKKVATWPLATAVGLALPLLALFFLADPLYCAYLVRTIPDARTEIDAWIRSGSRMDAIEALGDYTVEGRIPPDQLVRLAPSTDAGYSMSASISLAEMLKKHPIPLIRALDGIDASEQKIVLFMIFTECCNESERPAILAGLKRARAWAQREPAAKRQRYLTLIDRLATMRADYPER